MSSIVEYKGKDIIAAMPEHKEMLSIIEASVPEMRRATSLFYKTQSQFMDNMLTVSHLTPIRNLRQILAERTKSEQALNEVYFKLKKNEIEIKKFSRQLEVEKDDLEQELLMIQIDEIKSTMESTKGYISGAIRKITNYTVQYNNICEKHNLYNWNEVDFEKEEERYHIMKSFEQAIEAARSNHGVIDNGNHIYLFQCGINGAAAQHYVTRYFTDESALLKSGKEPSHEMLLKFLSDMADHFTGCSNKFAEKKGLTGSITEIAALKTGDISLLTKE